MSWLTWRKANTISKQYKKVTSDFAKDEKEWWKKYQWIAKKGYVNEETIWEYICLDEKHVKNNYYTGISNKYGKKLVAWIKGINTKNVIRKLKKWFSRLARNKVKEVATDMSNWMEKIAREVFTKALIVTDRFHVRKLMNELVWTMKNRIKLRISKRIEKMKKDARNNWKKHKEKKYWQNKHKETELELITHLHYQIRKNRKNWNRNQRRRWRIIKTIPSFKWIIAIYEMSMRLYDIYENKSFNKETGEQEMRNWIKKARNYKRIPELLHIANTIENRIDTITNYFISRHTNWYVEGFHSRLSRLVSNNRWFVDEDYMVYRFIKAFW